MTRGAVALGLEVVFFVLAFGWRSWVQWRRTGSSGFIRPRRGAPPTELLGAVGFTLALVLLVAAPIVEMAGLDRIDLLDRDSIAALGFGLAVAGIALTVAAQLAMGDSWRIGVDPADRTTLVVHGPFAIVRNPIFSAMLVATVGLVLLVPNVVSVVAAVVLVLALQVQVRLVEEPYLLSVHGEAFARYLRTTGRFVPGIGTDS